MASRAAASRAKQRIDRDRGPGAAITRDGKTFRVFANDLNALDSQALRRELGLSFVGLLRAVKADPDIDLLAGIEWLSRRVAGEQMLDYAEVAVSWTYNTDFALPKSMADDDTEAGAGSADEDGLPET